MPVRQQRQRPASCRTADACLPARCPLSARPAACHPPCPARCLQVLVRKAYNELYAAVIDKKVAMKMGPGDWRWVLIVGADVAVG